ncbi:MAG: hypothetical protein A2X46_04535 [Lentisphaerae bacterium GWF2_57_35]|nr:MAG: hypothetical protein A2X46_04535 [Lentisphaerae bacterium GWF2_57_35]
MEGTLKKALQGFPAVLVTGPRQSGKTTFLKHTLGKKYAYVSFDDPLQRQYALQDPNAFLAGFGSQPVILDEVQYVPELFSHLKTAIDRERERSGRWVLTGSQQFQMMRNVSDSLAGRIAILELPPFNVAERPDAGTLSLAELIWRGTYPALVLHPDHRELWLSSYLQTYVERDVRQLDGIRDQRTFELFLGLLAARHGQEINKAAISRECGISQPTVREWISILEASYIVLHLPPYFENLGKRLIRTSKAYFLDSALAAYLTRHADADTLWAGPMGGAFFEGWIVSELHKIFVAAGLRPEFYFWRSHDGLEVDLIIPWKGQLYPVEIKRTATPMPRHMDMLHRFMSLTKPKRCAKPVLVCTGNIEIADLNGTAIQPWPLFLAQWEKRIGR